MALVSEGAQCHLLALPLDSEVFRVGQEQNGVVQEDKQATVPTHGCFVGGGKEL